MLVWFGVCAIQNRVCFAKRDFFPFNDVWIKHKAILKTYVFELNVNFTEATIPSFCVFCNQFYVIVFKHKSILSKSIMSKSILLESILSKVKPNTHIFLLFSSIYYSLRPIILDTDDLITHVNA